MSFVFKQTSIPNHRLAKVARVEEIHCGNSIIVKLTIPMTDQVSLLVKDSNECELLLLHELYTTIDREKKKAVALDPTLSHDYTMKKKFMAPKRKRDTETVTVTPPKRSKSDNEGCECQTGSSCDMCDGQKGYSSD